MANEPGPFDANAEESIADLGHRDVGEDTENPSTQLPGTTNPQSCSSAITMSP